MIADRLLDILRCPQDRTRLRQADARLVERINHAILAQSLTNVAGERLSKPLDGGLIREAGDLLYPVIDQIPVMLPDEAIEISSIPPSP
jgi:uncharacterized protein YbaR (Trm112 family)